MQNPWAFLPPAPPYILDSDTACVTQFNKHATARTAYDLSLFPEPFFGSPQAPVVLLALNPGWSPDDAAVHATPSFEEQARRSLSHALSPYPFLHLQPHCLTPGSFWWRRIAARLIDDCGFEAVAHNMLCVQYFPYHSREYRPTTQTVPSQSYGFSLVRAAIARGADVVAMRSLRLWLGAVPELGTYRRLHVVNNPRNPALSSRNLGDSYKIVAARVRAGD